MYIYYKIVDPYLLYTPPTKYIIQKIVKHEYRYLTLINPIHKKIIYPDKYYIIKYIKRIKRISIDKYYKYIKNVKYSIIKNRELKISKYENIPKFYTRLYDKMTTQDYFYCKKIQERSEIYLLEGEDINTHKFEIVSYYEYLRVDKYSIKMLNLIFSDKTSSSSSEEIQNCIFNFYNIKGCEELYLSFKNKYNVEEIEEENNILYILNGVVHYKT